MQKRIYISIPLLFLASLVFSQTANPFDLKWRADKNAPGKYEAAKIDSLSKAVLMADSQLNTQEEGGIDSSMSDSSGTSGESETLSSAADADGLTPNDKEIVAPEESAKSIANENVGSDTGTLVDNDIGDGKIDSKSIAPSESDSIGTIANGSGSRDGVDDSSNNENNLLVDEVAGDSDEESAVRIEEINKRARRQQSTPAGNIGIGLFLILFGLALVILIWAVNINRGFIQKIYKAALNENFSTLLLREQRFASSQYLYYIVYAVFFLNAGLFLYLISRYATWDFGHRTTPMILFLGFLSVVYLVKHVVTRLLGETFQISKEMRHYNFNIILYNTLTGIILMPINLFLAFGPTGMRMPVIYLGLGILAFMYLMRQIRGILMGSHLIVQDAFQFFVYLCAIEILPVLVLFKFFPN